MALPAHWQRPAYTALDKAKDDYLMHRVIAGFEKSDCGPLTKYESDTGATVNTRAGDRVENAILDEATHDWNEALAFYRECLKAPILDEGLLTASDYAFEKLSESDLNDSEMLVHIFNALGKEIDDAG
jgi:hypothetical protein